LLLVERRELRTEPRVSRQVGVVAELPARVLEGEIAHLALDASAVDRDRDAG
jgi:hypothetical protein